MLLHVIHTIKTRTKIQVDTVIFLFCCYPFGVYDIRIIFMVIVKDILFTCVTYAATVNHHSEWDVTGFV